jgi:hypothetical protein
MTDISMGLLRILFHFQLRILKHTGVLEDLKLWRISTNLKVEFLSCFRFVSFCVPHVAPT